MNAQDLADLLPLGEGFTTKFKRSGTSNLGREICAFANATGGVILIGVTDAGQVVGVQQHNRLKSAVQAIARSAEPPIAVEAESAGDVLCDSQSHGQSHSQSQCVCPLEFKGNLRDNMHRQMISTKPVVKCGAACRLQIDKYRLQSAYSQRARWAQLFFSTGVDGVVVLRHNTTNTVTVGVHPLFR